LLNVFLVRRLAERITGSMPAGFLCALAATYHTRLSPLYYLPSFIYDVMCFAFYLSALNAYLAGRSRGCPISGKRLAAVLALYVGALDSKEMAVSLPVVLLLYEAIFHPPGGRRWADLRPWLHHPARPALIMGLMTALFIAGKSIGPGALHNVPGYRTTFTVQHILTEQSKYLNEILYIQWDHPFFTPVRTVLLWTAIVLVAILARKRHLAWAVLAAALTPMPIAVLNRGGACLYIPLAFWSLIVVTLVLLVSDFASRLVPAGMARTAVAGVLVAAAVAGFVRLTLREHRHVPAAMAIPTMQGKHVAAEVRRVIPHPRPGSRALYLNDLTDAWDTYFITELVWGDRTCQANLQHQQRFPPSELDRMDYLLEFAPDRTLRIVRGPVAATRESGR
jgi:hypothetical protein